MTLSPVSPSPRLGEGELIERGAAPLLNAPLGGSRGNKGTITASPFYKGGGRGI